MFIEMTAGIAAPMIADVSIDIDGTILAQGILFLVTLGLMHVLLFKPYLKTRAMREDAVEGSEEEAGEMGEQADVLEGKYDRKIRKARRDAQEVRDSLRQQGLAERDDIHQEVQQELDEKLAEQRAEIQDHVQRAREDIEQRAEHLADTMVSKLVANEG